MIAVFWQAWIDIREEFVVAVNKVCLDVGLRKHHLG